jgi:hypothetical protein
VSASVDSVGFGRSKSDDGFERLGPVSVVRMANSEDSSSADSLRRGLTVEQTGCDFGGLGGSAMTVFVPA